MAAPNEKQYRLKAGVQRVHCSDFIVERTPKTPDPTITLNPLIAARHQDAIQEIPSSTGAPKRTGPTSKEA